MTHSQIAHDLGRDLQEQVGQLLERKMEVARQVLEPFDLSIMLISVAVSLNLTAAATIAALADNKEAAGTMLEHTLQAIASAAAGERERTIAKISAKKGFAA